MSASGTGVSFEALVTTLATTAAVYFGDVPDPASGKKGPPNLRAAAQMIELLALIEQKTRGNLTADEERFLEQVLTELRLRFVQVREAEEARAAAESARPGRS